MTQDNGFTMYLDEKSDSVDVVITTEEVQVNERRIQIVADMEAEMYEVYEAHPDKQFSILYDIRKLHTDEEDIPQEVKNKYKKLLSHAQTKKIAILGREEEQPHAVQLILKLFNAFSKKKLGWFIHEQEARLWLQQ